MSTVTPTSTTETEKGTTLSLADAPEPSSSSDANEDAEVIFDAKDLSVYYSDFRAVRDVNIDVRKVRSPP